MKDSTDWLRVIHATSCDEFALERLVAEAMGKASALRVIGAPCRGDPLVYWRRIGEVLGGGQGAGAGAWAEVRQGGSQALQSAGEGVDLFYLERPARHGGDMRLVDAEAVAAYARDRDPILHEALGAVPVRFEGGPAAPVLGAQEGRPTIRWNPTRLSPGQGCAVEDLEARFCKLLQDMQAEGQAPVLRLLRGDALFLRADAVLTATVSAPGGERRLWKTQLDTRPSESRRAGEAA